MDAIDIIETVTLTFNGDGTKKYDIKDFHRVIVDGVLCDVVMMDSCDKCAKVFGDCKVETKNFYCGSYYLVPR